MIVTYSEGVTACHQDLKSFENVLRWRRYDVITILNLTCKQNSSQMSSSTTVVNISIKYFVINDVCQRVDLMPLNKKILLSLYHYESSR